MMEKTEYDEVDHFLKVIEQSTNQLKKETENDLEFLRQKVAKFFCEDVNQFKLEECMRIFVFFEQQFKLASEENKKRLENQQKLKARQLGGSFFNRNGKEQNKTMIAITTTTSVSPNNDLIKDSLLSVTPSTVESMSRSMENNTCSTPINSGGNLLERTASLNRRRSRPNSQDMSDLHSNLVEFLTNPSNDNHSKIDMNSFGSNFRRVGSGRRSARNLTNSSTSTIPEDVRERSIRTSSKDENVQATSNSSLRRTFAEESEIIISTSTSNSFNRFSPFRRTLNYKYSRDMESKSDDNKSCKVDSKLDHHSKEFFNDNDSVVVSRHLKTFEETSEIPMIKVTEPKISHEKIELAKRPNEIVSNQLNTNSGVCSNKNNDKVHKSSNNFIQQLTAIISPTKYIENNDELHQKFTSNNSTSNSITDTNIIVSTVVKERPLTLNSTLPPITLRRSSSFVTGGGIGGGEGKATNPVNAAIVMPIQKVMHIETKQSNDNNTENNKIDMTDLNNKTFSKVQDINGQLDKSNSKFNTSSSLLSLSNSVMTSLIQFQAPSGHSSTSSSSPKSISDKSQIPILGHSESGNKNSFSTISNRSAKANSISSRQQSAESKRIAWARQNQLSSAVATTMSQQSRPLTKSFYRTPSTISRTSLNSDLSSVQSLKRSSQLGTLSKPLEQSNQVKEKSSGQAVTRSFMKPTSSSVAKTRTTQTSKAY